MNPLALVGIISGAVKLGKIFWNFGTVIRYFKTVEPIAKSVIRERRMPTGCEERDFLKATADLARTGIIQIPGVDNNDIAKVLEDVEKEIECKAA